MMRSFSPIALYAAEDVPASLADDDSSDSEWEDADSEDEDPEDKDSADAESEVMLNRRYGCWKKNLRRRAKQSLAKIDTGYRITSSQGLTCCSL
jgi:hypothetical protein